jgi:hypothetical protein
MKNRHSSRCRPQPYQRVMTCAHDSKSRPASHSSPSYLDSSREKPTGVTPDDSAARLFWLDLQDRARKKSGAAADTATPRLVRLGSGLSLASSFHLGFGCPASRARGGAGAGFGLDPAWRTEPGFRGCGVALASPGDHPDHGRPMAAGLPPRRRR